MILFNGPHIIDRGGQINYTARVASGESLDLTLVCLSGGEASFDLDIDGKGADVRIRGLYVCSGDEHLDIGVKMRHNVGGSVSDQLFRGIAGGKSKVRFDGRIVVAHGAEKTEAYQASRNLMLSDTAVVETLPQLEIYADDVKCSHGATVGYLDENEQFYMRSRGISLEEARRLQMISFLSPVMESLDDDIRKEITDALKNTIE